MRISISILMLCAVVTVAFTACNKFDEGPAFSLRTKTFRATNNWRIENATKNGLSATDSVRINANLKSDGTVVFNDTLGTPDGDVVTTHNGVWEFDNSGENLLLVFTNPGGGAIGAKIWHILRLTTNELWVTETKDDDLYRYEFVPK